MIRLFVALRPPADIRDQLLDVMDAVAGARWQDDEQLHLTLRFIGEVERPVAEDIAEALSRIRAPAPVIALDGVGQFAKAGRANALWVGVHPRDALAALHRKVDQALVHAGLPPERRAYLPHITVARLPRSIGQSPEITGWIARHAGLTTPPFAIGHLTLYQSHLDRDGARYEPVARWAFDGAPGTRDALTGSQ